MLLAALLVLLAAPGDSAPRPEPAAEVNVQAPDPATMRKEAEEQTAAMRAGLKKLLTMVEKARGARDIVLLNCLNEKLTQMKALLRVGEQSNVNLQEFLAKEQVEGATHEKRKIGLAHDKVKALVLEAEACLGESGAAGGRTVVTVEKPDFPGDPTKLDADEDPGDLETLPSASPYN